MIDAATFLAVNDYEGRLLAERTGVALDELARRVDAVIETLGADGSRIRVDGRDHRDSRGRAASAVVDPTGCGDAYRAGLLYGIAHGWDWTKTGRLAALLGARKIAHRGGQNHAVDRDSIGAALPRAVRRLPVVKRAARAASRCRAASRAPRGLGLHVVEGVATTSPSFRCRSVAPARDHPPLVARLLRILRVETRIHGVPERGLPGNLLIVANHVSWLDIFVLNLLAARALRRQGGDPALAGGRTAVHERRHAVRRARAAARTRTRSTARPRLRSRAATSSRSFPRARRPTARRSCRSRARCCSRSSTPEGHVQPVAIRYRDRDGCAERSRRPTSATTSFVDVVLAT